MVRERPEVLVDDLVWDEVFAQRNDESEELERLAWLIVHHPKLRANYFADPTKSLEESLATVGKLKRDAKIGKEERKHKLALLIELLINADERLISSKETFHERESFLSEGVQDPQKTFGAVMQMSQYTFYVGVVLVLVGIAFAIAAAVSDQDTLAAIAAFFGGSGVITTLLAVFRASTKELRTITSDMAKIHMVLTGYGAETTNLRKIRVKNADEASVQNAEFRKITQHAISLLPTDSLPSAKAEKRNETTEKNVASAKWRILQRILRR